MALLASVNILCNIGESLFNSYIYVKRLPHFARIVRGVACGGDAHS